MKVFFGGSSKNKKNLSPKNFVIWYLWRILTFKINLHPSRTSNPSKNAFLLQQDLFLEGFGVPGGCKSILNAKVLHKSYIAKLFGPRVFLFFRWVKKKVKFGLFGDFSSDLKHIFNIYILLNS